jgi:hypothetical protein
MKNILAILILAVSIGAPVAVTSGADARERSAAVIVPCDTDMDCVLKNGGDPEMVLEAK